VWKKRITHNLPIVFVLLSTLACENIQGGVATPTSEKEDIPPTIDICAPLDIPELAFPRQEPVEGFREVMEAELVGDLILRDGCLQIESLYDNSIHLPLWPPEFTVSLEDDVPIILDGRGEVVGHVGEEIFMGGGEGSVNTIPACIREQLPAGCNGKVWVVGEGVRLNLKFDSDLFRMDLIPTSDRTAILLRKDPILDDWVGDPESVTGYLRFYYPDRCPRIMSESGTSDFLPIWPPEYSIQISDGQVEILDGKKMVIARQDEPVTLHGALVLTNWDNPNYRQLHYETPGDCFGPYWIVKPGPPNP
jgi:hypothetical protein